MHTFRVPPQRTTDLFNANWERIHRLGVLDESGTSVTLFQKFKNGIIILPDSPLPGFPALFHYDS